MNGPVDRYILGLVYVEDQALQREVVLVDLHLVNRQTESFPQAWQSKIPQRNTSQSHRNLAVTERRPFMVPLMKAMMTSLQIRKMSFPFMVAREIQT